jgi:putative transposase
VGSKGDSFDSDLAGTLKGLYEAELIHCRAPNETNESLEWVSCFNHHH